MDDFKLLGRSEDDLENETKIVKAIGYNINMNFGLEKCSKICLKKGRVQSKIYNGSTSETDIKELDPKEVHMYLGIEKSHDIQHKNEKEKLKKEYLRRMRLVLGKKLSAKNTIQAMGSLAVPALRYSFGIVNWHQEELQKLDRKMRKLLTIQVQHNPNPLYVPREQGRWGLMQLEAYTVEITKLVEYINSNEDPLTQTFRMYQHIISSAELQTDASRKQYRQEQDK